MFFLVRSLCLGDLEVIYLTATDAEYTEGIGQGQWKAMYTAIHLQQLFTAVTVGVILGKLNIGLYKYYLCLLSIIRLTTVDYKFMNIPNSRQDIASLVLRVEQLEAEQNVWKENTIWLKRYFDELKQEFKNQPELQEIQSMQEAIAQLSTQVAELQQRLNHSPTLNNGLDDTDTAKASNESGNLDNVEVVKYFFERVEQQQHQEATVNSVVNADATKVEQGRFEKRYI